MVVDHHLALQHVQECMIQGFRALTAWSELDFFADAELVWTQCSSPFHLFNSVLRADCSEDGWTRAAQRAVARAASRNTSMMWWGFDTSGALRNVLAAQGFSPAGQGRAMVAERSALREALAARPTPAPGSEVVIRAVENERELLGWSQLCCSVFGFPDFAAEAFYEMNKAAGLGPEAGWRHFTASVSGAPVAVSSLYRGRYEDGVLPAGACCAIANVATSPDARRRGLGSAVTAAALEVALAQDCIGATLLATEQAVPLYASLGFHEVGLVELFVWSPTS
jgi:GNAT superfamily N-acetyltransferase/flavin-binding protein dodecin